MPHREHGPGSAEDVLTLLSVCEATHQVPVIVGAPGVGKTSLIRQWSHDHGYGEPICVVGGDLDPTDVTGIPYPQDGNLTLLRPVFQQRAMDDERHVLFFDEFSNTPRAVQASLLKILGERVFADGSPISDNVMVIGAMNADDSAVDYTPIGLPMVNRLVFMSYWPGDRFVSEGISSGWGRYTALPAQDEYDEQDCERNIAEYGEQWHQLIGRFLRANSAQILRYPDVIDRGRAGQAEAVYQVDSEHDPNELWVMANCWASPRSWTNVADMLAALGPTGELGPIQQRILRGTVGLQGATLFADFIHQEDAVKPEALLRNPTLIDWQNGSLNEITEAENHVVAYLSQCNGKDGRPGISDVINYFNAAAGTGDWKGHKVPGMSRYVAKDISAKTASYRTMADLASSQGLDAEFSSARISWLEAFAIVDGTMENTLRQ
ncbi:AAA family ATPase [Bifidobacterium choloepi]|nr:AAA family ATPase [Bifidobacterium choloepi]